MLVILTDDCILSPKQVCQTCLLANCNGEPRWRCGQLQCGRAIGKLSDKQPSRFRCEMGFLLAQIDAVEETIPGDPRHDDRAQ